MKKITSMILVFFLLGSAFASSKESITFSIYTTDKSHKYLGTVNFKQNKYGVLITPNLKNLPQGEHGFHLHAVANCNNQGMDAMSHYDPKNTNSHEGPYGNGHLGDLPVLHVNNNGKANTPILAPRLKMNMVDKRALMIHKGGDNYTNDPANGGGGERIGCGVSKG